VTLAGASVGFAGSASSEVLSARVADLSGVSGRAASDNRRARLAFGACFRQTRGVADSAGDEMGSELDAIQERLRALKRRLDERQSVYALEGEMASGDPVEMNPLTAPAQPVPGAGPPPGS
jgi:hypothetical protein